MAMRIVYVNPGDLIDIRVIVDPDLPRNAAEWKYQTRPQHILLQYKDYKRIGYADAAVYFENSFTDGATAKVEASTAASEQQAGAREAFEDRHVGYEFPSAALRSGAYDEFAAGYRAALTHRATTAAGQQDAAQAKAGDDARKAAIHAVIDHMADNWPMKKYALEEIEARLREELAAQTAPTTSGGENG